MATIFDCQYPQELRTREQALLAARRTAAGCPAGDPVVGLALSGGGIRSATFCLGVLQALANGAKRPDPKRIALHNVDLMSTVSGGGYIGAFLGAMFSRPEGSAPNVARHLQDPSSPPVQWLRNNGRYLAPNGAGDQWLAGATILRNWVAVTLVMSTMTLTVLVAAQLVRAVMQLGPGLAIDAFTFWSPLFLLPIGLLVVALVPLGWAYWLGPRDEPTAEYWVWRATEWFTVVVTILMLVELGVAQIADPAHSGFLVSTLSRFLGPYHWALIALTVIGALTIAVALFLTRLADGSVAVVTRIRRYRNYASRGLAGWLIAAAVCLCIALIDTFGQAAYVAFMSGPLKGGWVASIGSALAALLVAVQKISTLLDKKDKNKRMAIPLGLVAAAAGIIVTGALLVGLSAVSHGLARSWEQPSSDRDAAMLPVCFAWTLALLALTWLLGRSLPFVNLSSLTQFYSARLSRTYIGASNPERARPNQASLSQEVVGDDFALPDYLPHAHGGPLHIVNVTLNETVEGRSQIEDRDRKGLAMAIGPAGFSIGVRHHARWKQADDAGQCPDNQRGIVPIKAEAPADEATGPGGEYHIWSNIESGAVCPQPLSLSQWTAISGAAVATGMGARTNVGLSLLLGIGNVRLGYWWDSAVEPSRQQGADAKPSVMLQRLFAKHFPVQSALTQELLAQFHGTHQKYWFLSDGGHFENTGCYELLRRRVPLIILCDDGADPDYGFEDLSNLVRKARLDFGADVRFYAPSDDAGPFGKFDDLIPAKARHARIDLGIPLTKQHLLLGVVTYPGEGQISPGHPWPDNCARSVLLVIKPSLTGDEPLDVLQYAASHRSFPQQTTADQFFDEAQWESYRKLGEHIGEIVASLDARDLWSKLTEPRQLV